MPRTDKQENREGPFIRTRAENNLPSVPVPIDDHGSFSSEVASVSIPIRIPEPNPVPTAPGPTNIPGTSNISYRRIDMPRSLTEVSGRIQPPGNYRRLDSYQLSIIAGPSRPPHRESQLRTNDPPSVVSEDSTPIVAQRRSSSLTTRIRRFFSRNFHSYIGRHRGGEDSRNIIDDGRGNDEVSERVPIPARRIKRVKYQKFPSSSDKDFFLYDQVMEICSVRSRSVPDLPNLRTVVEYLSSSDNSVADLEADFERAAVALADVSPDVSDLAVYIRTEAERPEEVQKIADSVAEDISENIKDKVCHLGSPW